MRFTVRRDCGYRQATIETKRAIPQLCLQDRSFSFYALMRAGTDCFRIRCLCWAKLYAYLHDIGVALVFRDIQEVVELITYAFPVASIFCSWSQSRRKRTVGKIVFVPPL